ncbi:unnamed protein product [Sphenostylis stenocarpa]|uniref:Uncharacterized protein n=1 Tax=Sphenostylis stenocarpa TaxID=92480 RepID=A0AA86SC30_9FABA|nr:unnamed protein product [Sphenostylis stenocarpa]
MEYSLVEDDLTITIDVVEEAMVEDTSNRYDIWLIDNGTTNHITFNLVQNNYAPSKQEILYHPHTRSNKTGTEIRKEVRSFCSSLRPFDLYFLLWLDKKLGRKMEMMAYQFSRLPYSDSLKLLEADIQHANAFVVHPLKFSTGSVLSRAAEIPRAKGGLFSK